MTSMQAEYSKIAEAIRHNKAQEELEGRKRDIETATVEENIRHNVASETESRRHNISSEDLTKAATDAGLSAAKLNAATQKIIAQYNNASADRRAALERQLKEAVANADRDYKYYNTQVNEALKTKEIDQNYQLNNRKINLEREKMDNDLAIAYENLAIAAQNAKSNRIKAIAEPIAKIIGGINTITKPKPVQEY